MAARRSPVVTLYMSESGLHPRGVLETGIIWPAQVAVTTELDVVVTAEEVVAVAVAPRVSQRVAADVVYGIVVEQFPCRSSNCSMR